MIQINLTQTRIVLFLLILISQYSYRTYAQPSSSKMADSERRICMDVTILSHDSMGGRESGTKYERLAACYIAGQFHQIGLSPIIGDSSYYQNFTKRWKKKSSHFFKVGNDTLIVKKDFGVTAFSGNGDLIANVFDAGWGPIDTLQPLDSNYRNKIVIINIGIPNGVRKKEALSAYERARMAIERGAVAVLFHNRNSNAYSSLFSNNVADPLIAPVVFISDKIYERLINETLHVHIRTNIEYGELHMMNVAAYLDRGAEKEIIIGAHYDHVGITSNGEINNGADDNASGIAGILELARILSTDTSLRMNCLFVAFSGEEKGLWGSEYYVSSPLTPLDNVHFMLNYDMIGRLGITSEKIKVLGMGSSPSWRKIFKKTSPDFSKVVLKNSAPPFSDHYPFLTKGIPVVYINTGLHKQYHTPLDDSDQINCNSMADIVHWTASIIRSASEEQIPFSKISGITQFFGFIGMLF